MLVFVPAAGPLSSRRFSFAIFVPALTIFILLLGLILLQQRQNIEVFLIQEDFLFSQALLNDLGLLADRLGSAVDLLKHYLHQGRLEL